MRLVWLLLFLLGPLQALAAEPFAKATVEGDGKFVPGQQVYVAVDVFAPDFFTSPPQFPLFEIQGALVTLPDERAQNFTQTIDGTQYSAIRRRYAVVPETPGSFAVPSIDIELGYSVEGKSTRGIAKTQPVSFEALGEPGAMTDFAARGLTIEQAFDRDPGTLKTGDALVRTITVTAEDTQAILMPPVDAGAAAGLAQYAKTAKTEDGISVGRDTASRRTETVIYTSSAEGNFTIPAVEYPWLDLDSGSTALARLPATNVAVAKAPAGQGIAPDLAPQRAASAFEHRRQIMLGIGLLLVLAAASWILWHLLPAISRHAAAIRTRYLMSRSYRLRRLQTSIRSAEPKDVYAALHAWSRTEGFRTIQGWTESDLELAAEITALEAALYSGRSGDFDRQRLARLVASAAKPPRRKRTRYALPDLNPGPQAASVASKRTFTLR